MSDDYVRYIDKTREYYLAQGYSKPYQWAHFDRIPFARLPKPLSECRIGLVTTSDIAVRSESGERESYDKESLLGNVYSIPMDCALERLYSRSEHYDRYSTSLDDVNAYCPITRLAEFASEGNSTRSRPAFTACTHRTASA